MNSIDLKNIIAKGRTNYEIIPVGINCDCSLYLRSMGIRRMAFPFDWNVTPMKSVIALIENDFSEFLEKKNLIFLPPTERLLVNEDGDTVAINQDIITPVVCRKYKMLFPHDFPKSAILAFDEIKSKYVRRINKLNELFHSDTSLIFVASAGPLNEWQNEQYVSALDSPVSYLLNNWETKLDKVLSARYPDLEYSICTLHMLTNFINKSP